ncbi:MAG: PilZ domain-containing protein [Syntrophales bacterium]
MRNQGGKPALRTYKSGEGVCGPNCFFYLAESKQLPGVGLCGNSAYILHKESCLNSLGIECAYFQTRHDDEEIGILVMGEGGKQSGANLRRHQREDVFVTAAIRNNDGAFKDDLGAVVNISEEGMALILGRKAFMHIKQTHGTDRFQVALKIKDNQEILLDCKIRRIEEHRNFVQLSVQFHKPLDNEMKTMLKMIPPEE